MTDPIDKAIETVENTLEMLSVPVILSSTKRPFKIDIPADMTDAEFTEMVGWMMTALIPSVRARRDGPQSRLVIARGKVQ